MTTVLKWLFTDLDVGLRRVDDNSKIHKTVTYYLGDILARY
jgi:hypothetical protein